jgi:hypothetical protein
MTHLVTAALELAAKGLPVFPCTAHKKPAISRENGGRGFYDAITDPDAVRVLFARAPHARLIGVPTGPASGFDVLDLDPRHDGHLWERAHLDQLPATLIRVTPGGGHHYHFIAGHVRNQEGELARGVDVRGTGGYVCFGDGYRVINDADIAPWPAWLLGLALKAPRPAENPAVTSNPARITDKRLGGLVRSLLTRLSSAAEGTKHYTLRNVGRTLGGYAHRLGQSDEQLIDQLLSALPVTVKDWNVARRTAAWAIAEGRKRPIELMEREGRP